MPGANRTTADRLPAGGFDLTRRMISLDFALLVLQTAHSPCVATGDQDADSPAETHQSSERCDELILALDEVTLAWGRARHRPFSRYDRVRPCRRRRSTTEKLRRKHSWNVDRPRPNLVDLHRVDPGHRVVRSCVNPHRKRRRATGPGLYLILDARLNLQPCPRFGRLVVDEFSFFVDL